MTTKFQNNLAVSVLLMTGLPSLTATAETGTRATPPRIIVRVYDQAGVKQGTLGMADRLASRVFKKAGVRIAWVHCAMDGSEANPVCARTIKPNEISLRLLRRCEAVRRSYGHSAGGVAMRLSEESGSGFITLFYDRIKELAVGWDVLLELVLGHAMAHEIGHLLLPPGSRSRTGIMRANLKEEDWEQAARGKLAFTKEQSQTILRGVLARSSQQEAAQLAALASLELAAPQARQPEGRPTRTTKEYFNVQNGSE